MRRYKVGFYPQAPHLGHSEDSLVQCLTNALPGVSVDELSLPATELAQASFALERVDDAEALNEVFVALQQLGYSVAEAAVTEWVDARVSGAVLGALGGGGAGSRGGEPLLALLASGIGLYLGSLVGSAICSERVIYRAEETAPGIWELCEVPNSSHPRFLTPAIG